MENISHQVEHLQRAGAGIVRIQELLAIKSKLPDTPTQFGGDPGLPESALTLEFESVTFGYDDAVGSAIPTDSTNKEIVLNDVSFHLKPGKVLGLLGRTGSGKTTLTRLLFRFYDPDEGQIRIGHNGIPEGHDIRQLPIPFLRNQVGMVTQNIQLFNASVRDNLTFFDRQVPDEKIVAIIAELGLNEWFQALPNGLDSVLESGGGGLSAGEAQLLAFTRIFLADPGLVVLDEASSRLDPATETLIDRAIERLVADRTAIIIAHRLGTVQKADEIMILDQGQIEEYGPREALATDPNSRFYQLLQTGLEEVLV